MKRSMLAALSAVPLAATLAMAQPQSPARPAPAPAAAPADATDRGTVERSIQILADRMATEFLKIPGHTGPNRIAIVHFENNGRLAFDKKMGQITAELLTADFATRKEFQVVEREQLQKVLEELKLSLLGLTDEKNAAVVGKLLDARTIVTGSVSEVGSAFAVVARMVDVETGRVLYVGRVNISQAGMLGLSDRYLVRKTRGEAAFRGLVPGFGQVYNDQPVRGAVVAAATGGLLLAGGTYWYLGQAAYSKYRQNTPGTVDQFSVAQNNYRTGDVLMISAAGVWVLGILDAYVNGPDTEEVRIPPREAFVPPTLAVAPTPGGAVVALSARF